jgi:hypothetical protein
VIYSVPPYISAAAMAQDSGQVWTLPMIHVFDKPKPGEHGAESAHGIALMESVIDHRYPNWRDLVAEDAMHRMIVSSGGDLRELFQLLRAVLILVDSEDDSHFPISVDVVEFAEKKRRTQFGFIPASYMDWLQRVVQTHLHGLVNRDQLGILAELLDGKLIYQYRNGENWYDVHPLLRDAVRKHGLAAAAS